MGKLAGIVFVFVILVSFWPYFGFTNYHEILGVTRWSSKEEISRSYRQLAKQFHPDRYLDDVEKAEATERFKEIANAYESLKYEKEQTGIIRILIRNIITVISAFQYCIAVLRWIGGHGTRPKVTSTLWVQLFFLICTFLYFVWYASRKWAWMWFNVKKEGQEKLIKEEEEEEYYTCETQTQVYYTCQ